MTGQLIGTTLRRLRLNPGQMSQATIAELVGVTRRTLVALETDRYAP